MRLLAASLTAMALMIAPASAQFSGAGNTSAGTDADMREKHQQRLRDEIDRKYLESVKRRGQHSQAVDASNDPWAGVRSSTPARSSR